MEQQQQLGSTHTAHCAEHTTIREQLDVQLHGEYAKNNHSYLSSVISLLAALIAVVGVFFYVYANVQYPTLTPNGKIVVNGTYTQEHLVMVTTAAVFVLFVMLHICIALGCKQRKEQFIIHHIRQRYYGRDAANEFPTGYHPFGKSICTFVQGLFGMAVWPIICTMLYIVVLAVWKGSELDELATASNGLRLTVLYGVLLVMGEVYAISLLKYVAARWKEYTQLEARYEADRPENVPACAPKGLLWELATSAEKTGWTTCLIYIAVLDVVIFLWDILIPHWAKIVIVALAVILPVWAKREALWNALKPVLKEMWGVARKVLKMGWTVLKSIWVALKPVLKTIWKAVEKASRSVWKVLKPICDKVCKALKQLYRRARGIVHRLRK